MRFMPAFLLVACALTGCGKINKPDGTIEGRVKFVAQTFAALGEIGFRPEGLTEMRAEGRVLVLKIDTGLNVRGGRVSEQALLRNLRQGVCGDKDFRELVQAGAAIRFDLLAKGITIPPTTVNYCPPVK